MIKMMIAFIRDYFRYKEEVKKHDKWIKKFVRIKGYDINPNKMLYTNLKIWLAEMEKTHRKGKLSKPMDDIASGRDGIQLSFF